MTTSSQPTRWAFVPAEALYRQAVAALERARKRSQQFAETGNHERRWREIDAAIAAVTMTQAAAESWINWAYVVADVAQPGGGWVHRWREAVTALPAACGGQGRSLEAGTVTFLTELSAWRNFLVHGDQKSRDRLGQYVPAGQERDHLTAALAEWTIQGADAAFTDAGGVLGVHGVGGLHSAFLWVSADEL
jgi:hypothetical protein